MTLAGSRFLSSTEQRYAPIEGEALAVAWGLEQTRYFTQGCPNLIVVTDHKPLVKIFGDRTLDEISNTRLFRLKQRTLPWYFEVTYLPGKTNHAADATSRHPSPLTEIPSLPLECEEHVMMASISREAELFTAISWSNLAIETSKDASLSSLMKAILDGSLAERSNLSQFAKYKDSLYVYDGVILYNDRVLVPPSLRKSVLAVLHSAHQGVSTMERRAQSIVFWPGMISDIEDVRKSCSDCNKNSPSQAHVPSEPADPPTTPFEQVFADFFDYAGHHYLVAGDRLSGWTEIFSTPVRSSTSGSRGLISCLRKLYSTFGVPEELSSDGGPEFIASETKAFCKKWGVRQRISSAYFPRSNGRAEVAVKSAKRLLHSNINASGSLDNDRLLQGLLQLRNTPDPDCHLSPAQIIFGRPIRDTFSFLNRLDKFSNHSVRPVWREAWSDKESALRTRFAKSTEQLNQNARPLPPLNVGDHCFVQNQVGNSPRKWDRTGIVVETRPHDQYCVKIDGSGRVTVRNRRFLRKFEPASTAMAFAPPRACDLDIPLREEILPPTAAASNPQSQPESPNTLPAIEPLVNVDPPSSPTSTTNVKMHSSLKRLLPHNMAGPSEAILTPEEGGRRTRTAMNLGGM